MPDCYLLAVVERSSIDRDTNNFSLYNLIETVQLKGTEQTPEGGRALLPLELHAYWLLEDADLGREFQWRFVAVGEEGEQCSKPFPTVSEKRRMRYRVQGFPVLAEGDTRLFVEWRFEDADGWQRCAAYWPLEVDRIIQEETRKT